MKLTPFAKAFLTFVVLLTAGYITWHRFGTIPIPGLTSEASDAGPSEKFGKKPAHIVVGVNDFGGAYPGLVANDGAKPGPKSLFTAAGLDIEFKLIKGSKERLAAFDAGEVDIMLLTLDYVANLAPNYAEKGEPVKAFLMADWSRGNLGIVAKPGITSIKGLRDAKVVTTRNTPTHYLLLTLLKKSNLKAAEIEKVKSNLVFATKTPLAGEIFRRGEADAVAIWEPHLSQSMADGKGHLLVSTATATNLVADVLFAKADFLKRHESEMAAFARAWFAGVDALQKDPEAAVPLISKAFQQGEAETRSVASKIKPATFADNREFFGLEREHAPYLTLFDDAARFWQKEGVIQKPVDAAGTRWMKALEALAPEHAAEKVQEHWSFHQPKASAKALLTKSVSIYFASGSSTLDPNARRLIDDFAETLSEFGNAYIRVEGNTDSQGSRARNVELSRKRADALVDYLIERHNFDRGRFSRWATALIIQSATTRPKWAAT